MADLTLEEFRARLRGGQQAATSGGSRNVVQVAPVPGTQQTFQQRYGRLGVPLDDRKGVPWETRMDLSFMPDDASKVAMLQRRFKGAQVEPIEGGQFILRGVADPETSQPVDLLVDERDLTLKDFADLTSAVPEVAAGLVAMRGAAGVANRFGGMLRTLVSAGAGATGAQTMGALTDAAARLGVGQPVRPGEIAQRRGVNAAIEVAMGGVGDLVARGFRSVGGTVLAPQNLASEGVLGAVERVKAATGVEIPLTLAEQTGRPLALRAEAVTEKTPLGGIALRAQKRQAEQSLREVQRHMLGVGPLPEASTVGQKAVETLRQFTQAAEAGVDMQVQRMASRAQNDLADALTAETGLAREVLKEEAGAAVRGGVVAHEAAFRQRATELFDAVGADPVLPTAPLRGRLEEVRQELVKARNVTTEASPLVDANGRPILSTTEGREVVREFVPEGLQRFIRGIEGLDEAMPLSELRALRTQINDAVNQSEIIPGVSTRLLRTFSNAVTEAVEQGVAALPDQGVRARLAAANQFYRENLPRFQTKGVMELLADPQQLKLGNRAVVRQALNDPDQYFRLREALTQPIVDPSGAVVSPAQQGAWNLFRQAALTEMESKARLAGTGTLMSGKKFLDELNKLDIEVMRDLLGENAPRVVENLRTLGGLEGKVDVEEFMGVLRSGNATGIEFQRLAARQADLDRLYQNNVIRKFVKGEVGSESVQAGEFVDRFLDTAKSGPELSQVMAMLSDNPAVVEDIRRKTVQKFFKDAERVPSGEDIARGLGQDPTVMADPKKLYKDYQADAEKLRTVLGDDTYRLLGDYLQVEAARFGKDEAAKQVGGLIGGNMLSSLLQLKFADTAAHAKYFLISQILTSPTIRGALRQSADLDPTDMAKAVVASTPFMEAVAEDYGAAGGQVLLQELGERAGLITEEQGAAPVGRQLSEDEFRSRLGQRQAP